MDSLGLPRSTTYRLAAALVDRRMLVMLARYVMGASLLVDGGAFVNLQ